MNEHDIEKRMMEKTAIELFIQCFYEMFGVEYRLVRQQERPDAVIEDSQGTRLGVEVTHLFYDELEVKMLLGKTKQKVHGPESLDQDINVLNALLKKKGKAGLSYSKAYPNSLLIRNTSPIWTKEDYEGVISRIKVPKGVYKDIWLLTQDRSSSWRLIHLG